MDRPNILLIVCHDLGRYLSCYGRQPISTPNLDRLAAEGILFTQHFCTCPSCSPSRGSIVTGRYPHSNGLVGLVNNGWELPQSEKTLAQYLQDAGYDTRLVGQQHERKPEDAASLGYDRVIPRGPAGAQAPQLAGEVVKCLAEPHERPFFICMGTSEPHRPFGADDIDEPGDVFMPPFLPRGAVVAREMAGFTNLVQRLDDAVGSVLQALDRKGLAQDTLVIFTTDHGIDMPRAKGTLYDPGIETALLMRWPKRIAAGSNSHQLLSNVDLVPTLLQMLDVHIPDPIQGRSFLPLLDGQDCKPRDAIFAEKTHHCAYDPMRCIRTQRHKYIFNFGKLRPLEIPADVDMDTLASVPHLYTERRPLAELYDLAADPNEQENLAGAPDTAQIEAELHQGLHQWMQETDDPLLEGILPIPKFM